MLSTNKKSQCAIDLHSDFRDEFERIGTQQTWPVRPPQILYGIRKVLGDTDILVSDVGTCKFWAAKFYPVYSNNTFLMSNGFASMGFSLPTAIVAKAGTSRTATWLRCPATADS